MSNGFVCAMGIGTVFIGLICLVFITCIMSAVCRKFQKPQTAVNAPAANNAAPAAAPAAAGEGKEVKAPMQGTILSVNVKNGDTVKKGQVLFILEAMKMENEIMAGDDGVVTSVCVDTGAAVQNGTLLCTIK